jgi:hypothetical protein
MVAGTKVTPPDPAAWKRPAEDVAGEALAATRLGAALSGGRCRC